MTTSGQPDSQLPPHSTVVLLLADIGQTTWRMFVPTLGGFGLGIWVDHAWHTKPGLMIAGLLVGIAVAGVLVARQFRSFKEEK